MTEPLATENPRHCVHCADFPGEFTCCRCTRHSSGYPGDSLADLTDRPCQQVRGRLLRHVLDGPRLKGLR